MHEQVYGFLGADERKLLLSVFEQFLKQNPKKRKAKMKNFALFCISSPENNRAPVHKVLDNYAKFCRR
jgi:hypothetical protein